MTSFRRFLCFFHFWSIWGYFWGFCVAFRTVRGRWTGSRLFDSRLYSSQVLVILVGHTLGFVFQSRGGLGAPRHPGWRWVIFDDSYPHYIDPSDLHSEVRIWKFWKIKKFAPKKKMKCDNNSSYELQDGIYGLQGTPCHALWFIRWHFSDFENSKQWINYFMILMFFTTKKKFCNVSKKLIKP